MCHHSQGAGGCFEGGDEVIVVVNNVVGVVNGGHAGIVSGGVAALEGVVDGAEGVGVAGMGCLLEVWVVAQGARKNNIQKNILKIS